MVATDLLHVGARGYGVLSAAPSAGAAIAGLIMAPLADRIRRRGAVLLWAVAAYGVATIGFGLTTNFGLAFACLALTGAADNVSMVIRNVIRQLATPDRMRGRMTSVNMVFFMGGPQLGELEAGLVAQAFGVAASVVSGGVGCVLAVAWIAARTPALRGYRREHAVIAD
jgi:MFS family permease